MKLSDENSALFQHLARHEPRLAEFLSLQLERIRDDLEQVGADKHDFLRGQAFVYRELLQHLDLPTR